MPLNLRDVYEKTVPLDTAIKCSKLDLDYLEEMSRGQSTSLIWHEMRAGRITSSVVHDVLHTNQESPSSSLIAKICSRNISTLSVPPVMWGREHEADARSAYATIAAPAHDNFTLTECRLIVNEQCQYLAASPDGLILCRCCGKGVLEIKCPFAFRDKMIAEIKDNSFLDTEGKLKK